MKPLNPVGKFSEKAAKCDGKKGAYTAKLVGSRPPPVRSTFVLLILHDRLLVEAAIESYIREFRE